MRRTAFGTALLAAAIPLTSGAADAASFTLSVVSSGNSRYGCAFTGESCKISAGSLIDYATPITLTANGEALGTVLPTGGCCDSYNLVWTPTRSGKYVIKAQQGEHTASTTVEIVDTQSLQGIIKRYIGS
ncbi:hypothetical protein ACWDOP_02610 [Nocardia sp. NPDC003693]